jgi:hypothetical protein
MSDTPFGRLPDNPYASPSPHAEPGNPLRVPAMFLLVLSALFLLLLIASLPGQVVRFSKVDLSTPAGVGELMGGIVGLVGWTACMVAVLAGSICMLRLRGYGGAWAAAICAVVPVCSPCFVLGIPFGIWAIVLLRKPEVRQRFR